MIASIVRAHTTGGRQQIPEMETTDQRTSGWSTCEDRQRYHQIPSDELEFIGGPRVSNDALMSHVVFVCQRNPTSAISSERRGSSSTPALRPTTWSKFCIRPSISRDAVRHLATTIGVVGQRAGPHYNVVLDLLWRSGWGEFPVRVQLHFVDTRNKPVDIIHHLKVKHPG
jgi:hypothetical protein